MKKALRLALALFAVLLVGLAAVPVLAVLPPPPPPPPTASSHLFHGTVTVAGSPAIDGTLVSAHIGSLAWSTTTKSGQYGADPLLLFALPADNTGTPVKDGGEDGDTVIFKVSGVEVNSYVFKEGAATALNLNLAVVVAQITGVTGEVNCDSLGGVTVQLFAAGGSTTSDGGGSYVLPVPAPGSYDVVASKAGFRNETQANVVVVVGVNTLDFRGDTGLVPNEPDASYAMDCVHNWLFPPSTECGLSAEKAMDVIHAWLFPIIIT